MIRGDMVKGDFTNYRVVERGSCDINVKKTAADLLATMSKG